jgi:hypothetical protein
MSKDSGWPRIGGRWHSSGKAEWDERSGSDSGGWSAYQARFHTEVGSREGGADVAEDETTVNGDQATSLADLTKNLNHRVQVQADQQGDNSLLAWKITVGGPANPNAGNGGTSGSNGDGHGAGSNGGSSDTGQRPLVGTVGSVDVGASSFVLKETDGTSVTVTVSGATQFLGSVHALANLKANMHVTVKGTKQADGTIAASSIQIGA